MEASCSSDDDNNDENEEEIEETEVEAEIQPEAPCASTARLSRSASQAAPAATLPRAASSSRSTRLPRQNTLEKKVDDLTTSMTSLGRRVDEIDDRQVKSEKKFMGWLKALGEHVMSIHQLCPTRNENSGKYLCFLLFLINYSYADRPNF